MRRIPDVVFEFRSRAEERVFSLLRDVDLGQDWAALHSLNCSEHAYKKWSEIDFLIVGPGGIFVLEVKGGGVSCHDGIWRYENRYGDVVQNSEGPFNQAKSARYALERLLKDRFDLRVFERPPVFGFGVVFPDTPWAVESPEMPRVLVADREQAASPELFENYLRKLISYWSAKHSDRAVLTPNDRKRALQALRPDVDVYPPFSLRLGQVMHEMQTMTDEQFERLDAIEANERVIVSGGAGTGKTFLMMQCARREASLGRAVLVVVESPVLASFLRKLEPSRGIRIEAYSSLSSEPTDLADVLFVDEGQDLLSFACLMVLDEQLKGGLEQGRWRWFMDENNQSLLRGEFDPDALEDLRQGFGGGAPSYFPLRNNIRNTKEIVSAVEGWTGAALGKTAVNGHGSPPMILRAEGADGIADALARRLDDLQELGVPFDSVGIVVPEGEVERIHSLLPKHIRRKCLKLDPTTVRASLSNKAVIGSVADFKGLERPVVVVVGVGDGDEAAGRLARSAFYVASTRANYDLTLITNDDERLRSSAAKA